MKIITYATHRFGTFNTLIETVPDIIVLGWGTKWNGFMGKCKEVLKYLENVPDDEVVMVVDGFDTIIKKDLSDVEHVFKRMNCKILLSKHNGIHKYIGEKIFTECNNVIANAGLYMGYCGYVKFMLREILKSGEDDYQIAMNMVCNKVSFIRIDTDCIIFENCFNSEECVKKSQAYIVGTPGKLSVQRYSRAVKEYSSYFIPELVIIIIILYFFVQKTCTK
jgi:hypothetical protein